MRSLRLLSRFLFAAALLAACSEQTAPTALDEGAPVTSVPGATANAGLSVVLSVTGSGQTTAVGTLGQYAGIEEWRTFSLNVLQHADGSVSGHAQYNNRANGGAIQHGKAVCIHDTGYEGWIAVGFEVTKRIADLDPADPPAPMAPAEVGGDHGFVLIVQDNGEGAAAAPDQLTQTANTTMLWVNLVCGGALDAAVPGLAAAFGVPVEAGNIQVRP